MTEIRNGGAAMASVEQDDHPPDPRGVRVTVVDLMDASQAPLVLEPAAVPVEPMPRSTGLGVLGGVAPVGDPARGDGVSIGLTADGHPVETTFDRLDAERGVLRLGGSHDPTGHRILLLDGNPGPDSPRGVVRREVVVDGWRVEVEIEPAARAALRERARRGRAEAGRSGPTEVHAIIPGVVVSVSVAAGDQVTAGQQLLVVEAMKMQNELRAPREGTIERVAVGPGTTIEVGDLLLVIS
jgi:biotin carboxyl carrier protein